MILAITIYKAAGFCEAQAYSATHSIEHKRRQMSFYLGIYNYIAKGDLDFNLIYFIHG